MKGESRAINLMTSHPPATSKTWLNEISFMRPILLVMLVSYHAFAPYVGSWSKIDGISDVDAYWWIGQLSRAFRLEGFVFVSGYVFTYQIVKCRKFESFRILLQSKIKRLLIPGFFFSALYIFCFKDIKDYEGGIVIINFFLDLLDGVAHLWYLPCLFWCFLIQYLLIKKNVSLAICLSLLLVMVVFSIVPLPFRLNRSLYYMLFFYGGGLFWHYSWLLSEKASNRNVLLFWFVFVLLFFVTNYLMGVVNDIIVNTDNLLSRGILHELITILKIVLSWSGITALYLTACRYCKANHIGNIMIKIGTCGYGVYIFHQFILVYLYRYTEMPHLMGTYFLPWAAFFITITISVSLTLIVRSTQMGRRYL